MPRPGRPVVGCAAVRVGVKDVGFPLGGPVTLKIAPCGAVGQVEGEKDGLILLQDVLDVEYRLRRADVVGIDGRHCAGGAKERVPGGRVYSAAIAGTLTATAAVRVRSVRIRPGDHERRAAPAGVPVPERTDIAPAAGAPAAVGDRVRQDAGIEILHGKTVVRARDAHLHVARYLHHARAGPYPAIAAGPLVPVGHVRGIPRRVGEQIELLARALVRIRRQLLGDLLIGCGAGGAAVVFHPLAQRLRVWPHERLHPVGPVLAEGR